VIAWSPGTITVFLDPFVADRSPLALDTAYPVQVVTQPDAKVSNARDYVIAASLTPAVDPPGAPEAADQPAITGMGGEPFCPGGPLIIHGSGFGDTQGRGFVAIGVPFTDSEGNALTQAYAAPVMSWSAGAIYAELLLPDGAEPGAYTVTIHRANGLSASGELTVGACPA
jgi:hypothetical protein